MISVLIHVLVTAICAVYHYILSGYFIVVKFLLTLIILIPARRFFVFLPDLSIRFFEIPVCFDQAHLKIPPVFLRNAGKHQTGKKRNDTRQGYKAGHNQCRKIWY